MIPSVAIVILNWNGRHYLQQFLPSVAASTYAQVQVIVADNASSDDSVTFLQEHYPAVRIILLPRNFGFAKGYNEALKQVKADYYVLLNSDVEVQPGWIEPVIALMESDPVIGACQPKILMERNRSLFEYAGAAGGWIDSLGYPFARGRVFDHCETDLGQYDDESTVFWASGAAMFVRSSVYHACGGLDEYFFAHMEEIDLCWRMQLGGYRIMSCPKAVVYHVGGGTLPKGNAQKVYLNFRNNLIMLFKNLPVAQLLWKLPLRLALDGLTGWKSLFSGDGAYFIAVFRAHVGFVAWLLTKGTRTVKTATGITPLNGWLNRSIVWAYFIQGKRKFSEIVYHKPVKYKP
ncbi:MAG: glycosyltransferase family 2 protein [Chitinophagaceae bacterium]